MLKKLRTVKENLKQDMFGPDTMKFLCRHCKYEIIIEADEEEIEKVSCKGPSGEHHAEQEMVRND